MNVKESKGLTGGLGFPSKMPGASYGLPAAACPTGSRLAAAGIDGPCNDCYALKGNYQFPSVQGAQAKRLASIDHPDWTRAMVWQVQRFVAAGGEPYFRWHDSGDLQSEAHFERILDVAAATPDVRHWLPTQEWGIVRRVLARRACPSNLAVRFSSRRYGEAPRDRVWAGPWSSVVDGTAPDGSHACPAPQQGNACGDCRACWDPNVRWVVYHKH